MPRILLLIILFWLLYNVLKRLAAGANQTPPTAKPTEKIVQCSQCDTRIPESESHLSNGLVICNNPQCDKATPQK
jgi:hypothetical protein